MTDPIFLNVGGVYYCTSRATLQASPYFACLLCHSGTGEIFIDRDPSTFRFVLHWLRGTRVLPESSALLCELLYEADFFGMHELFESAWTQADLRRIPLTRRPQRLELSRAV